ncbi:MAG: hypothetical protein COA57_11780 [Flavobacteriales bacterium]|nr:MAG: hypothetical protein COA57_11780 [Flavobacteriales bacterium]
MAGAVQFNHKIVAFYQPLRNKKIDAFMRKNRQRFGTELIPKACVAEPFTADRERTTTFFFGADQSPLSLKTAHWMTFLNQDTACMTGHEFFAKKYNLPVVYFDVQRAKRGFYTVELSLIEDNAAETTPGEITEKYTRKLEEIIKANPEHYLWSHRRWKRKRPKKM